MVTILVTGAAGFIGSHLVKLLRTWHPTSTIISLDLLTYAGSLLNLQSLGDDERHIFVHGDVADRELVADLFTAHEIEGVIHLAAESHVDRSILEPLRFLQTNVMGTAALLEAATREWERGRRMRFLHISTDEVFGELSDDGLFNEDSPYMPRSPYSASKAASDHLVRAWYHTYGLPVVVTNCSNNYGPFQFPEKLIPVIITRALAGEPIPIYGQGVNVRDWLYVEDHCRAIDMVFRHGAVGATYCIGGDAPVRNIDLAYMITDQVDTVLGRTLGESRDLVAFVKDRPGHDYRYAMDSTLIRRSLGWKPAIDLAEGLRRTVDWYIENQAWCAEVGGEEQERFESEWYASRGKEGVT